VNDRMVARYKKTVLKIGRKKQKQTRALRTRSRHKSRRLRYRMVARYKKTVLKIGRKK